MVESVDTRDLKSLAQSEHAGSSPVSPTRAFSSVGKSTPLITGKSSVRARECPPLYKPIGHTIQLMPGIPGVPFYHFTQGAKNE